MIERKAKIKEECVFYRYYCPKRIWNLNCSDPEAQTKKPDSKYEKGQKPTL